MRFYNFNNCVSCPLLCTSYVIGLSVVDGLVVEDPAKLLGASTPTAKLLVARAKNAEDLSNSEAP